MLRDNIYTNNLTIGYDSHIVQKELTFALHGGELVTMLGRNGCGKSTLLHTLAGLIPPISGDYTIGGEGEPERRLALVLTERVSLENTKVFDVVAMGRYPYTNAMGRLQAEDTETIMRSLAAVGLDATRADGKAYKDIFFNDLSDGEKQRVLIAKALAQQTPVILLDEPTAHLDLPNRIQVLRLLRTLAHEQQKTILLSTHELDLALQLSDRILLMSKQGVALDTPANLKAQDAFDRAFGMNVFNIKL